jgi:succinyl-CoA synthetase alpha subunit
VPPAGSSHRRHLGKLWNAADLAICITRHPSAQNLCGAQPHEGKEPRASKRTLLLGPNCPGLIT